MEAFLSTLIQQSGASDFLIVRDDAASIMASPIKNKTQFLRLSSSSVSSSSSSPTSPCVGPPSLPRRKISSDDIFKLQRRSSDDDEEKAAKNRVLKSFFDEVMGPTSTQNNPRSEMEIITDALNVSSSITPTRWDASPPSFSRRQSC